jgi:hypothetical protein
MKRALLIFTALSVIFLFSTQVFATYYKWVDDNGKVWITDYPNPKYKKHKKAEPDRPAERVAQRASLLPEAEAQALKRNVSGPNVFVPEEVRRKIVSFGRQVDVPDMSDSTVVMIVLSIFIFLVLFYFYVCLCLFIIARKVALPNAWAAWVPIVNLFVFVSAADRPRWWVAIIAFLMMLTMVPVVGIIFDLLNIIVFTYLWMCVSRNLGKSKWLGLLMLVPVANIIFPAFLAFSKDENFFIPEEHAVSGNAGAKSASRDTYP